MRRNLILLLFFFTFTLCYGSLFSRVTTKNVNPAEVKTGKDFVNSITNLIETAEE